ncbi:cell division protein FtsK [Mycolicibacterium goodii]|uniref:cell division protein FtsK n=1 Tax=Mycolicibacterium goodii TaxID=134601 RepID=UPI001BDBE46A|nr:cell division protein FtsK [Mycolicibacterium goodii]MBU8819277.1 cell division protein FtsK [Mycolicibacterium goodii]
MTKIAHQPEMVPAPYVDEKSITIDNPEELDRIPQSRPPAWVWALVLVGSIIALMVILVASGARQLYMGAFILFPMMIISMVMMLRNRGDKSKRPAQMNQRRADYTRKLDEQRASLHEDALAQAREIAYHHPDPRNGSLLTLVGSHRMHERGPDKYNFGHVRMGVGFTRIKTTIVPPEHVPPEEVRETVTAVAARYFLLSQNVIHDVARPLHLWDEPGWAIFCERDDQRPVVQGWLRALISQLAVFHSPGTNDSESDGGVRLAIISDDEQAWEAAKWLPHTADPEFVDASGPARLIFRDVEGFMERFGDELAARPIHVRREQGTQDPGSWLVVVVDCPGASCAEILGESGKLGVSVIEATGDESSILANPRTAFFLDEEGNLLRASAEVR